MERGIESTLIPLAQREGLGVVPYYALARGFLTGKYREGADNSSSPRAPVVAAYLVGRGPDVLAALEEISSRHGVAQATIALAWLAGRPTVIAPIASARIPEQLPDLLAHVSVELSPAEIAQLDAASEPSTLR